MLKFLSLVILTASAVTGGLITGTGTGPGANGNKLVSVQVKPKDDGYHVKVQGQDQDYNLQLKKPETPILSPGFQFTVLDINENGISEIRDHTPTPEELKAIQDNTYLDTASKAVVNVREHNGQFQLHGIIENSQISHHEDDLHILTLPQPIPNHKIEGRSNDYVDLHRNITLGPQTRTLSSSVTTASPEVLILFDYANYVQFSGNTAVINDYLSVFYHAVNNRYDTNTDPKITITVSGVMAFNSRSAQPFMEEGRIADGSYDMNIVLDKLSYWVFAKRNELPKHDVASLLSGEEWKTKDSSGKYVSGIAGLAYLAGACWTSGSRYFGTSVNADKGGFWNGVGTAAHELAHNLNAPHDGDSNAASCPWSAGNLMSYEGWGSKSKFYFSSCSQSLMRDFVNSQSGSCVKTFEAPSRWALSRDNPGDRLDLTAQCKKLLNKPEAISETANRTPEDICRNIKCRVAVTGGYTIYTMNRMPADESPCSAGKVCRNGDCVSKI